MPARVGRDRRCGRRHASEGWVGRQAKAGTARCAGGCRSPRTRWACCEVRLARSPRRDGGAGRPLRKVARHAAAAPDARVPEAPPVRRGLHVMLCYIMLCYVMLCHVMLCYIILYYNTIVILCYKTLSVLCYILILHRSATAATRRRTGTSPGAQRGTPRPSRSPTCRRGASGGASPAPPGRSLSLSIYIYVYLSLYIYIYIYM